MHQFECDGRMGCRYRQQVHDSGPSVKQAGEAGSSQPTRDCTTLLRAALSCLLESKLHFSRALALPDVGKICGWLPAADAHRVHAQSKQAPCERFVRSASSSNGALYVHLFSSCAPAIGLHQSVWPSCETQLKNPLKMHLKVRLQYLSCHEHCNIQQRSMS